MGLLVLGLAAGCRSTQTVYRVTPAVGGSRCNASSAGRWRAWHCPGADH